MSTEVTTRASRANGPSPELPASGARGVLLICACVLATGLAVVHVVSAQTTRPSTPQQPIVLAQSAGSLNGLSGMTTAGGDFAAMTSDGGDQDLLMVLDQRAEELLIYRPDGPRSLDFVGRASLRELFVEARLGSGLPEQTSRPQVPTTPGNPAR